MPHSSAPRLRALHALKLKGFADADTLSVASELEAAELDSVLAGLAAEGLADYRQGRLNGWTLTADGRAEHARLVTEDVDASGRRPEIDDAYRRFLSINGELLDTCTAWQLRDRNGQRVVNDHSDPAYDQSVKSRLGQVHTAVQPICADLADSLDRYGTYGPRLQAAMNRISAGDLDWFTRPVIDSYHTVWFELHEDLLASLGIERAKEAAR